jgi:hypothetical protein
MGLSRVPGDEGVYSADRFAATAVNSTHALIGDLGNPAERTPYPNGDGTYKPTAAYLRVYASTGTHKERGHIPAAVILTASGAAPGDTVTINGDTHTYGETSYGPLYSVWLSNDYA